MHAPSRKLVITIIAGVFCVLADAQPAPPAPKPGFSGTFNDTSLLGPNLGTLQVVTGADLEGLALGKMAGFQLVMEPCTLLYEHTHTQSELAYIASGSATMGVVYTSNGTTQLYSQDFGPGGYIIFPAGLLHYAANTGCTPVTMFAAVNQPTFDVNFYPAMTSFLPLSVLQAAYNISDPNLAASMQKNDPPPTAVLTRLPEECSIRCNLTSASMAPFPEPMASAYSAGPKYG